MPTHDKMKRQIAKTIRSERIYRSWTQAQLMMELRRVGVPRSTVTVGYWEQGRHAPDLEAAVALADLFDISVRKLITGRK